jgi:hypothetical protein
MLELWDNPLIPIEERLEIAAGSVKFWRECYRNQFKQKEELQAKLAMAEEHISMAFHPDLGWAIKPEDYSNLVDHYTQLQLYWSTKKCLLDDRREWAEDDGNV